MEEQRERSYDYVAAGDRIKRARKQKGLTQEFLSNEIGVNMQHVSDIERGEVGISIDTLLKLSKALDLSTDYVLSGKDYLPPESPIAGLFAKLDEKDKLFVLDFIELYVKRQR